MGHDDQAPTLQGNGDDPPEGEGILGGIGIPRLNPSHRPSFDRLREVLFNRRPPGGVPFFEVGMDPEIIQAFVGRLPDPMERENWAKHDGPFVRFYHGLGYDYVPMGVSWYQEAPYLVHRKVDDTAILSRGARKWAPMEGQVRTREDYESFPWSNPSDPQTERIQGLSKFLPEGMEIVALTAGIMQPLTERVMGVKNLSRALYRDPKLVEDVCRRLGEPMVSSAREAASLPEVGAVLCADDLGYRKGTLISPDHLRKYVLPWHRRLVRMVQRRGKPVILHSCGNIINIMEDVIEYCGYDTKHSFKDSHTPVTRAKELWGDRIALLGGIDVDLLARGTPAHVRKRVREVLEICGESGYALGSGNSITNYMPIENFTAMLDEGLRFRERDIPREA